MKTLKILAMSAILSITAGFSPASMAEGGAKYFDVYQDGAMFCRFNPQYTTCIVTRVGFGVWRVEYNT